MSLPFEVTQGTVSVQADFAEPAFHLFQDSPALYSALFGRLSRHGLRPADMKVEFGDSTLGDFHLRCFLYAFAVTIRVRIERVEILCDATKLDRDKMGEVIVDALEAVRSRLPDPSLKAYTVDSAVHGSVKDKKAADFVSQLTKEPLKVGPPIGAGCIFYYGPDSGRLSSSVALDLSGYIKDGVFLRVYAVWDGKGVEPSAVPSLASTYFETVLSTLGLTLTSK
jgi:hypothetical protein